MPLNRISKMRRWRYPKRRYGPLRRRYPYRRKKAGFRRRRKYMKILKKKTIPTRRTVQSVSPNRPLCVYYWQEQDALDFEWIYGGGHDDSAYKSVEIDKYIKTFKFHDYAKMFYKKFMFNRVKLYLKDIRLRFYRVTDVSKQGSDPTKWQWIEDTPPFGVNEKVRYFVSKGADDQVKFINPFYSEGARTKSIKNNTVLKVVWYPKCKTPISTAVSFPDKNINFDYFLAPMDAKYKMKDRKLMIGFSPWLVQGTRASSGEVWKVEMQCRLILCIKITYSSSGVTFID